MIKSSRRSYQDLVRFKGKTEWKFVKGGEKSNVLSNFRRNGILPRGQYLLADRQMAVSLWNLRQKMEYPPAAVWDCAACDFSMPDLEYGWGDGGPSAGAVCFG